MAKSKNKITKFLRDRVYDVADLAGNVGICGIVDYVASGFNVSHPLGCVAVGSGLSAGEAGTYGRTSRLVTSIVAGGLSLYPEIAQLASSGDLETFVKGAGARIVGFGIGAVISGLACAHLKDKYDGLLDVNVVYENEADANRAFEFMQGLVKVGDYIRSVETNITEPQKTDKGYVVSARIVGKTEKMQENLRRPIESYVSQTLQPLESKVSDVIKIRGD